MCLDLPPDDGVSWVRPINFALSVSTETTMPMMQDTKSELGMMVVNAVTASSFFLANASIGIHSVYFQLLIDDGKIGMSVSYLHNGVTSKIIVEKKRLKSGVLSLTEPIAP